ncbi:MAG: hypothetical protein IIC50_15955 [Planctomycetes bacterium]|nr:hypothetical protein [Planctomycetota bacterium]
MSNAAGGKRVSSFSAGAGVHDCAIGQLDPHQELDVCATVRTPGMTGQRVRNQEPHRSSVLLWQRLAVQLIDQHRVHNLVERHASREISITAGERGMSCAGLATGGVNQAAQPHAVPLAPSDLFTDIGHLAGKRSQLVEAERLLEFDFAADNQGHGNLRFAVLSAARRIELNPFLPIPTLAESMKRVYGDYPVGRMLLNPHSWVTRANS